MGKNTETKNPRTGREKREKYRSGRIKESTKRDVRLKEERREKRIYTFIFTEDTKRKDLEGRLSVIVP